MCRLVVCLFVCLFLGHVQSVEHEHVVVVLGEGDHVAVAGDLEAAASAHLHRRTLELADHVAGAREHGHVEAVAVAVADQHVALVAHVDAVRKVGHVLAADLAQKRALLAEHAHAVALHKYKLAIVNRQKVPKSISSTFLIILGQTLPKKFFEL